MSSDSVPAPTLDELPPQKGSILELHSIGHSDFDGLIVEFLSIDKSSGKYLVASMKDGQGMKVKPKVCRRPDMKPYKLRQALERKAAGALRNVNASGNVAALEAPMNALLSLDPCCAPAYLGLGGMAVAKSFGNIPSPEAQKKIIRNLQRGLATVYAYEDFMAADFIEGHKAILSLELGDAGRLKAASRVEFGQAPGTDDLIVDSSKAWQEFYAAERLLKSSGDLMQLAYKTKQFEKASQAVDRYLKCIKMSTAIRGDAEKWGEFCARIPHQLGDRHHEGLEILVQQAAISTAKILICFVKVGAKIAKTNSAVIRFAQQEGEEAIAAAAEGIGQGIAILDQAVVCLNNIYAACTTRDEKVLFLSDELKAIIDDTLSTALNTIETYAMVEQLVEAEGGSA